MGAFLFYIIAITLAFCIIGSIADAIALFTGYVHPCDFN